MTISVQEQFGQIDIYVFDQVLRGNIAPGMRVLDVGAGSGILSIAAARLGASYVEAVEIEPVAAGVCRQNVERNGLADIVSVRLGTLQGAPDDPFDVVLANISVATLLELHPVLALQLRRGGLAVLSGVLAERADELWETLRAAGWRPERTDFDQDWVALLVRHL